MRHRWIVGAVVWAALSSLPAAALLVAAGHPSAAIVTLAVAHLPIDLSLAGVVRRRWSRG